MTTITIHSLGLRNPSNIVPACALNVFPHSLQRYRRRAFPWLTIVPSPLFPLAMQSRFGQNTCDAFICSVLFSFISTAYKRMLFFSIYWDSCPPVSGVLPNRVEMGKKCLRNAKRTCFTVSARFPYVLFLHVSRRWVYSLKNIISCNFNNTTGSIEGRPPPA